VKGEVLVAKPAHEPGVLAGFAVWRHAGARWVGESPPSGWEPETFIRVVYLALDQRYRGERTSGGERVGDVFYATVERRARTHERSRPGMLIELFCDSQNGRGLAFWRRQGFRDIGPAYNRDSIRRLLRVTPTASD
jgi:hypothetical protein